MICPNCDSDVEKHIVVCDCGYDFIVGFVKEAPNRGSGEKKPAPRLLGLGFVLLAVTVAGIGTLIVLYTFLPGRYYEVVELLRSLNPGLGT